MSQTHSLVCHATKEKLWIGQGTGGISCFYYGEKATMEALRWFLDKNKEHTFNLLVDDTDWDCTEYACWSGVHGDWRIKQDGVDLGVFKGTLPEAVKEATGADPWFYPPNVEYAVVK